MGTILLTGAYGLVGHSVHRQLQAAGRTVIALDLTSAAEPGYPIMPVDVRDTHRLHAVALSAGPIDAVIHCGAFSGPMLARDNPNLLIDVNLNGTANLLELARLHGVPRFVLCSSVSAVGHTPAGMTLVDENVPLRPTTVYGATKAAAEALVQGYAAQHGVSGVCLRIGWVYGPRRTTSCDIRDMIASGLSGQPFSRPRGQTALRQYVHADDVARALILAADAPAPRQLAYLITEGTALTLPAVADLVRSVAPGASITIGPGVDPEEDIQSLFDISAAARDLGYTPRVALAAGIADYTAWMAEGRPGLCPGPAGA